MSTEPTYTETDRERVELAAGQIGQVISDISHHEIGEDWELHDDTPAEIARLRARLDQMQDAVTRARAELDRVVATARLRAVWEPALRAHNIPTTNPGGYLEDDLTDLVTDLEELATDGPAGMHLVDWLDASGWTETLAHRLDGTDADEAHGAAYTALETVCAALTPEQEANR